MSVRQMIEDEKRELLRDKFAAAALTGILSGTFRFGSIKNLSEQCYQIADKMLEARELKNE